MPVIHLELLHPGSRLTIWQITESEEELITTVTIAGRPDFIPPEMFKNRKRRLEWLATRCAYLKISNNQSVDIYYGANGKPYPGSGKGHLSVSHAWPYVCLFEHETLAVGVDIERMTDRIINIISKYINGEEMGWISTPYNLQELYLIWAAKESAYKMKGDIGVDFRKNLTLMETNISKEGIALLKYSRGGNSELLNIYYRFLDSMILVYTIATDS